MRYLLLGLLLCASSVVNSFDFENAMEESYVGIDLQHHVMGFKRNMGDTVLKSHSPKFNFYFGKRLDDVLSLEAGYEVTNIRACKGGISLFGHSEMACIYPGTPEGPNDMPTVIRYNLKMQGPHIDLVAVAPIREGSPLSFMGSIGLSYLKAKLAIYTNVPNTDAFESEKKRLVARLTGGLQYKVSDNFYIRGVIGYVDTKRMSLLPHSDVAAYSISEVRPKGTLFYNLGVNFSF